MLPELLENSPRAGAHERLGNTLPEAGSVGRWPATAVAGGASAVRGNHHAQQLEITAFLQCDRAERDLAPAAQRGHQRPFRVECRPGAGIAHRFDNLSCPVVVGADLYSHDTLPRRRHAV